MSAADLETELRAWREPTAAVPPSDAEALPIPDALTRRNAGNFPDRSDRSLRLVLVLDRVEPGLVERERLRFEPDYHEAPTWRREGSRPVNVVPLRAPGVEAGAPPDAWWEDETMAALEEEWRTTGSVSGLVIPGEWRGFVFKTVASLRAAGREVTVGSIADSVARWLAPSEVELLRRALEDANP
jgi:hypothetical protein